MSWRTVVISSSAKLDYQMGYLIVRNQDVVKVHISEIVIEPTLSPHMEGEKGWIIDDDLCIIEL